MIDISQHSEILCSRHSDNSLEFRWNQHQSTYHLNLYRFEIEGTIRIGDH